MNQHNDDILVLILQHAEVNSKTTTTMNMIKSEI